VRTTYGSRIYENHIPDTDAPVVARIRRAGGVLVGKTNTPEFAIFIRTVNRLQPETLNPWDRTRTAGGSSGGAAASIAAGLTPVAVGSDGGGSVRIPSALCGVVGLMPSRGAVPRGGGNIGTRRFSAAGPMALLAQDAQSLWTAMAGPDRRDPLSCGLSPTGVQGKPLPTHDLRLRWIGDSGAKGAEQDVVDAVHRGAAALSEVTGSRLHEPDSSMASPRFSEPFYAIMQSDRLSTGGRELIENDTAEALLTGYARHHLHQAAKLGGDAYSAALEMQLEATEHLLRLLEGVDVVVTPTVAAIAPTIPSGASALPEDARRGLVAFTFLMNYTGFPAATVPCGLVRGMPVGLQLIGRPGTDADLLRLCQAFQEKVFLLPSVPTPASAGSATTNRESS
jgi:Asp-tRNA(Asn)/Glu-tRNA(Gln) amidotransferase A subunit family amidase